VEWPAHWERGRLRPGLWAAEGHRIKRVTPNAGSWDVTCPRIAGRRVGGGEILQAAVDALADHLWDCKEAVSAATEGDTL
jgi:hypothetical protein